MDFNKIIFKYKYLLLFSLTVILETIIICSIQDIISNRY